MTTQSYKLAFCPEPDYHAAIPDEVIVEVDDVFAHEWLRLSGIIKREKLLCMERFDNRCEFIFDGIALTDLTHDVDFRPEFMRVEIQDDAVKFVGLVAHDGGTWFTDAIELDALAADFGLNLADFHDGEVL